MTWDYPWRLGSDGHGNLSSRKPKFLERISSASQQNEWDSSELISFYEGLILERVPSSSWFWYLYSLHSYCRREVGRIVVMEENETVSRSLQRRHALAVACCKVRGTECGSACTGPFEGGRHYLHYLHSRLVSGQTTGREHSPTLQQKVGLKIYWVWLCPSEQNLVSPTVSVSHQDASISLLSLSLRGHTEWKPQSQKTNQTDHMDYSIV